MVQLVGGEHARLTQAERNIEQLTETCARLDEENKILRDQLLRQQQHNSLQIEELLDNVQVPFLLYYLLLRIPLATQVYCNNKTY